jgi:hypothetical protein
VTRVALVLVLLATCSCATTTAEREDAAVRSGVDIGRFSCGLAAVKRVKLSDEQRRWCAGEAP